MHGSRSDIFVWHRYYIPTYVVMALFAGLGSQALIERVRLPRLARVLSLALPAVMLVVGYPRNDRSRYRIAEDFSRSLLRTLPPGAHLMASDDNILFVLIYLSLVEGVRPDVDLVMQGAGGSGAPQLRFDPEGDPLFMTHHPNWTLPALEIVPVGLVFRALRAGSPLPEPMIPSTTLAGENDPRVPKDNLTRNLIGDFHYMLGITWEIRDWPRARDELELASKVAFDNDVLHYNLGLIYWRNGLFDRSLAAFQRSAEINPRHLASNDRVYPMDKVRELRAEVDRVRRIEASLAQSPELLAAGPADASSPEWHLVLATLLDARGEELAALGHRLRAAELGVHGPPRQDHQS
jgi:tetratricopeptide (TPR) repeat protein